jgi:chorismate dehydratase
VTEPAAIEITPAAPPTRVGVVSFVNTLPLIDGLERLSNVRLRHSVPSLLIDQLLAGDVDLALCSSIDYQRSPEPLVIVPAGALACHGPTLTVRLYSQVPVSRITRVYCDTDSHTSICLMQILLREVHGFAPELIDYDAREHVADNRPLEWPEAVLLIGDKVVTDSPPAVRYPTQVDLGELWHQHTGLPFVFATWMALAAADPAPIRTAAMVLERQRLHNQLRLDRIIHDRAEPRGWPADLARDYLKPRLHFELGPEHLTSLELFYAKAHEHGLIETVRQVRTLDG